MAQTLSPSLQVAQLRARSVTAGLALDLSDHNDELVKFLYASNARHDLIVTVLRYNRDDLGAEPRRVEISVRSLLALARLENDHPARAPVAPTPLHVPAFGGKTFDPEKDEVRLAGVLAAVHDVMEDGKWRTLFQISNALSAKGIQATEAGVSARLRDLRKPQYGARTVLRERVPEASGLWRYRLDPKRTM